MPDEEESFTFVDKRKTSVATEAGSAEESASPQDVLPVAEEPRDAASSAAEAAPTAYDLLLNMAQFLAAEAWLRMGLIANPATGVVTVDLPQARVVIDTVSDIVGRLESAPEGAVEPGTRRDLRNLLNDLRLNFVNQSQSGSSSER